MSGISSKTPHYIQLLCLLWLLLAVTVSQTFLVFDDLDSFEEYWAGLLEIVPQLGFVFLIIRPGLCVFQRKRSEVKWHFIPSCLGYILSTGWITIDTNLDHLAWLPTVCQISPLSSSSPVPYWTLWEEVSHSAQPTPKEHGAYGSPAWGQSTDINYK